METRGLLAPETEAATREAFEAMAPAARTVTSEVAKAMSFDREEYSERVTGTVVETARDVLFASLLQVHVGTDAEFEDWVEDRPDLEVHLEGNEHVTRRAWHPVVPAGSVAAVTFHEETEAAIATVRRQAFGRFYGPLLERE